MPRTHRPFWPGLALLTLWPGIVLLELSVCQAIGCASNPVAAAQDSEQRAYALYGTFVIVEEQAAKLISSPQVPNQIVSAIKLADSRAKPSADALVQAVRDYDDASHQLKAGSGSADKVNIASANLLKWVSQAQTDVSALVAAVKQGS